MRPKTRQRLLILAAITAVFVILLGTAIYVRRAMQQSRLVAARDLGLAAFAQGRYDDACGHLADYLRPLSNRNDPDLVYKFALSHKLAADGNREHLDVAKNWFQLHLAQKPGSLDASKHLLDIYSRLGRVTEALEAADQVLRLDPVNTTALRTKIECQRILGRTADGLASAQKLAEAMPEDVENRVRVFFFLRSLGRTADILPDASKRYASKPDSAASEIIMSVAYALVDDLTLQQRTDAWALAEKIDPDRAIRKRRDPNVAADSFGNLAASVLFARKAAGRPLASQQPTSRPATQPATRPLADDSDLVLARVIVGQLQRLGLVFDELALLETIDPAIDDPWVRGPLVLRLWECNRFSKVNERLAKFPPKLKTPEGIELHAIHAISLMQMGQIGEASKIVDELSQMKSSKAAVAWEMILRLHYLGGRGDQLKLAHAVKDAIDSAREQSWPHLWASLGDAYFTLGERDLAANAFGRARDAAPLWFVPRLRLSRLLVDMGQMGEAVTEAGAAYMALPHPLTQGNYLIVAAAKTAPGGPINSSIAQQVTELQQQFPGDEPTLPLYINVLVQANRKDEARKVLRQALAREKPLPLTALIGLTVAGHNAKLGLENECLDVAIAKYGMTPELAIMQASVLGSAEKPVDVLNHYKQVREKSAKPEHELAWRLGWARLLESIRNPDAAKAWVELGDDPALKDNLMIQKSVLDAASAQADRSLIDRTIERLKAITGDDAAVWREARARVLMQEKTPAATAQARQLLDETIRLVPTSSDAHLLLGVLLESQGDLDGALKRFAEAARLRPNPGLAIRMALLHLQRSEFAKAKELLNSLSLPQLDDTHKVRAAMAYSQLGDLDRATAIAKDIPVSASTDIAAAMFLVQLDRRNGNTERAESRLRELVKTPGLATIAALADLYASTGRMEQARATLDQLQSLKLEAGQRELAEAQFFDRHCGPGQGDNEEQAKAKVEAVTAKFASAAKAIPNDAGAQVAYISHLLRRGRFDDALAAARQASSTIPSYIPLGNFLKQQQALSQLKGSPEALALGDSILHGHPDSAVAAEAINLLIACRTEPLSLVVSRLRPLADRSPLLPPLQLLVINGYRAMGLSGEAANIASRTARAIPNAVEFARLAAQAQAEAGEWNQALAAAQAWRQLTPANTVEADLFCAEAYVRQSDYSAASKVIEPYLPAARKNPKALAGILRMQSRILVATGDYAQARELLKPLLKDKPVRTYYFSLATTQIRDVDVALIWLKDLDQVIPAGEIDERVNLAEGWIERGARSKRDDLRTVGRDMLKKLLEEDPTNVAVVFTSGLCDANGDPKATEAVYRKVLALDPKHAVAMNNLAMLLAEDNRNLDEAGALIAKAVAVRANVPAFLDTQAYVEGERKHRDAAIAAIQKCINLEPANPAWRLRYVELLLKFGDRDGASRAIGEIDQRSKKVFSEEMVQKLQDLRKKASGTSATLPSTR